MTIYTDGSALTGNTNGGGGILVTSGPPSDPQVHQSHAVPAGRWCSSFQAEMKAVVVALEVIEDAQWKECRLVTDSQSTIQRLNNLRPSDPPRDQDECDILQLLASIWKNGCKVTFTWCPSHCGIRGNELADEAAKQGAQMDQNLATWHYESAKAAIRRATIGKAFEHERMRAVSGERGEKVNQLLEKELTRKEQVTLNRLRCGHHMDLKYWLFKIGRVPDLICRKCGLGEETIEHVITECPRIHRPIR